jgi:hypothetical protein
MNPTHHKAVSTKGLKSAHFSAEFYFLSFMGLDSGTPFGRAHAQRERRAAAARRFGKECRGCTPFPARWTPFACLQ